MIAGIKKQALAKKDNHIVKEKIDYNSSKEPSVKTILLEDLNDMYE